MVYQKAGAGLWEHQGLVPGASPACGPRLPGPTLVLDTLGSQLH